MPSNWKTLVAMGLCLLTIEQSRAEPAVFQLQSGRLAVRSADLELAIEGGAIAGLRDLRTGEVFSRADPWAFGEQVPSGSSTADDLQSFITGRAAKGDAARRLRPGRQSRCEFHAQGPNAGELVIGDLPGGQAGDRLTYRITIEPQTGEIIVQAIAEAADPQTPAVVLDVPVLDVKTRSVVLGNGARYVRGDPPQWDSCIRVANGLNSPRMAVIEGQRGCVAVWADKPLDRANVLLRHDAETDHLLLHAERSELETDPRALRATTWRFRACRSFADAARRYRELFEKATGAKPLWENRCLWTRSIHAVCTEIPAPAEAEAFYAKLARLVDPKRLLLFYWNGSEIILFGDHRYMVHRGKPRPETIAALRRHGFRWIGYHPYNLVLPPHAARERIAECAAKGELPAGYRFQPDYAGPPERFPEVFRPIATGYYAALEKARLWVLHPGSRTTREYLVANFDRYCRTHQMDGAYMDTLGADHDHMFPAGRKVIEGLDYRRGEELVLGEMAARRPDLGVMSELESEWTVPGSFYTWEGTSHVQLPRAYRSINTKLNHPLRTALWGSYTWTRDDDLEPAESALIGGLPPLVTADEWTIARARLFAGEELYNDLPAAWDPEALAYYRGREGKWFQYRRLPCGEGFVEETPAGHKLRLGVFRSQTKSPLEQPVRIQDWSAYRQGRPIGLDPDRDYPFLLESPEPDGNLTLTDLPEGVFVAAVRHNPGYSVVELGTHASKPVEAKIGVTFHRSCLRVCDPQRDTGGPFANGSQASFTVTVPGGLVFLWQEPQARLGRFRSEFTAATGRLLARGVADRAFCYNSWTSCKPEKVAGREYPAVRIGAGRFRGFADQWFQLAAGWQPVLKFDIAYQPREDAPKRPLRPMQFSVAVNGQTLWSEELRAAAVWQAHEVSLARWAGRKVLVTLSAQVGDPLRRPAPSDAPALFGRVRIDGNPSSLEPASGGLLPRPRQVFFQHDPAAAGLDAGWRVSISPNQRPGAAIAVDGPMIRITGEHYKYAYLSRPAPGDNISVQARFQLVRTGCSLDWNPGLGFYWGKGRYTLLSAGGYHDADGTTVIRGFGARRVPLVERRLLVRDDNRYDFWLRLALSEKSIGYDVSTDGRSWHSIAQLPRTGDYRAPPKLVIVGRGVEGPGEVLSNDERWPTNPATAWIGEILVGRNP